jgi:hypothetical protein
MFLISSVISDCTVNGFIPYLLTQKKNVTRERVTGGLHARIGVAIVV